MTELHYIYLGNNLPKYTADAVKLAERYSGVSLNLLGNAICRSQVKNLPLNFIAVEDFYDTENFSEVKDRFVFSKNFRDGFWLKTLERFFVMEQFMQKNNMTEIFHAELDQLLFNAGTFVKNLKSTGIKGVFLPFHDPKTAVASVFFCNNKLILTDFVSFSTNQEKIINEMELLASWAANKDSQVFSLPSLATEIKKISFFESLGISPITESQIKGVVDPLQIGPWIGGNDPRNEILAVKPKTKFVDAHSPYLLSKFDLQKINFSFDSVKNNLVATSDGFQTNVYNLHFHSKLHPWLNKIKNPENRLIFLANSSKPVALRFARRQQIKYRLTYFYKEFWLTVKNDPKALGKAFKSTRKYLKYFYKIFVVSLNLRLKRRPSSSPFLSGDTFRNICNFIYEANSKNFRLDLIKNGDLIFCQSDLFIEFNSEVLSKLDTSVSIVFGNSDQNFNSQNSKELNLKYVKNVFAQNLEDKIEKFTVLPIGLENAWRFDHGKVWNFKIFRVFKPRKIFKIMWSFNVQNNLHERKVAQQALTRTSQATNLGWVSNRKHLKSLLSHAFVASPPGNGLDCHRTWEAMYLRCIPIVTRSFMTEEYEKLGLPIWIVDSYNELIGLDEEFLKNKYAEIKPRFDSDALWFDFWENKIRNSS